MVSPPAPLFSAFPLKNGVSMPFPSAFENDELYINLFVDAHTDENIQNLSGNPPIEDDPAWFEAFG